jgi:hypothetical protein
MFGVYIAIMAGYPPEIVEGIAREERKVDPDRMIRRKSEETVLINLQL